MPAIMDDPDSPTIYRTSGIAPFPDPHNPHPSLPADVIPRQVTLRDRLTIATIVPFASRHQVPPSLLAYLSDQFNKEIENGDTYPMIAPMPLERFSAYWFQNFGAVMLLGRFEHAEEVADGRNWTTECFGSFYIKPNYPGRSSHVCNAGFLVTEAARNRGVGRLLGESYLEWAPNLGYTYSVFNLVYETNVASCRIWDALGFKRIGRVKGCGNLKSYPGQLIDAIIYGRDLTSEGEDPVSEDRFDKIKFYLKYGKYPNGADRAEKSRLRSSATHYKLLENDKLMLKDKEVISDPQRQYEISRDVHVAQQHGGINKTTAAIAEKYHWVRIKETVNLVTRNCVECKEMALMGKPQNLRADGVTSGRDVETDLGQPGITAAEKSLSLPPPSHHDSHSPPDHYGDPFHRASTPSLNAPSVSPPAFDPSPQVSSQDTSLQAPSQQQHRLRHQTAPMAQMQQHIPDPDPGQYLPLDPQIMDDVQHHLSNYVAHDQTVYASHDHQTLHAMLSPQHSDARTRNHDHLRGELQDSMGLGHVDGDLDMLIEEDDDDVSGEHQHGDEEVKTMAQAAAQAAEAVMTGDESKDNVELYGNPYRD